MQIHVVNVPLFALLDSVSPENLLSETAARQDGIEVEWGSDSVTAVNQTALPLIGKALNVPLLIGSKMVVVEEVQITEDIYCPGVGMKKRAVYSVCVKENIVLKPGTDTQLTCSIDPQVPAK